MNILHVEDSPVDAELVHEILATEFPACVVHVVKTRDQFIAGLLAGPAPDLILSDFALPAFDGPSAFAIAREQVPDIPFIFLSGSIGEELAIGTVRDGAYDYVLKGNMARLGMVIRRALADFAQRRHRKEDERRLVELAGIIERANEAIVVSNMAGSITLWNDGAARLYGIRAIDALGRSAEKLLSYNEFVGDEIGHDPAFETGEWQREMSLITRDGRAITVDFRMTLVRDDAGRPSARLAIATDITAKKKLEEQFLRAQRLESLGLLAAGIAHDLNNVLAPVFMATPLLRERATAPEDQHMLDILDKSAERGSALVRQILGFAHGSGGGLRPTQVKYLLRDISDVVQASFPKSITLDEFVPGDLWPIQANPTQIHQILLNLVVNACDAMLPGGGTLRLRAENTVLTAESVLGIEGASPGAFLMLEVADTGTGIPPEVLARIWEPFFTTKGEGTGTGLGLSTVRGITASHGGFATVETEVGRGTTFRVYIPADETATASVANTAAPLLAHGHGETILLVDDEADVRRLGTTILTKHGYRVIACQDGMEAVAVFKEQGQDIQAVISDLNMPKLGGSGLAVILRRLRPDIRIMAMTGLGDRDSMGEPGASVFCGSIQKPFTIDAFLSAVRDMLHSARV